MYTPLYIKTDNSLQTSMIKINDLIEYALNNNIKSLTITDNNMYGVMDFYKACINNGIKPIIGLEIKYKDYKIVLYAVNYNGYKNLIKLSTLSSEKDLELNFIESYSSDIICIVPYESLKIYDEIKGFYKYIYKSYKNKDEYISIKDSNKIYMNETLYLKESDKEYIKYIDAIREGISVDNLTINHFNNYILKEDEFIELYKESIENNYFITEISNIEIPFNQKLMPKYINEDGIDSFSYLKKQCIED